MDIKFWAATGLALIGMGWAAYAADWANIWVVIVGGSILFTCAVWHLARLFVRATKQSSGGPVYWTLTEAISWIAFGEAVTSKDWTRHYLAKVGITPDEEKPAFDRAEAELFEKLRDANSKIDIQGRKEGKGIHEPIPPSLFLSAVGANILHDSLGVSYGADIETIFNWDGPNWSDVRIKRDDVLRFWPKGGVARSAPLMLSLFEAATRAYEQTRGTTVAGFAEIGISKERTSDNILTWYCFYLWQQAPLFGNYPPSRVSEQIDYKEHGNSYDFHVVNNRNVILRDRYTARHFENVHLRVADFSRGMKKLAKAARDLDPLSVAS